MRFVELAVSGAWTIEVEPHSDERGWFGRSFCREEFAARGLNATVAQTNLSATRRRGTVRGLHWEATPSTETKLVRCVRGEVMDVLVDLRAESPSYLTWTSIRLTGPETAVYVPSGVAHGFQTLTDDVLLSYTMGDAYRPGRARGLRHDDPTTAIDWPLPVTVLSETDASWPFLPADRGEPVLPVLDRLGRRVLEGTRRG